LKILVIVSHPDDEVLGCGGSICKFARAGQEVYIALMSGGIGARYNEIQEIPKDLVETMSRQSHSVAQQLGARRLFQYDLPDNRFDTIPLLKIAKIIEELISTLTPGIIITHHGGDLNIDHRKVFQAVMTATRPSGSVVVRDIYSCEIPSSTDWAFQHIDQIFKPNVFIDITDTLEEKVQALKTYETEVREFPHPRSPEAVRVAGQRWGSVSGCNAAEAFELIRSLR
jgi:LmbE family N-acetylglucosaminyl deacetylase